MFQGHTYFRITRSHASGPCQGHSTLLEFPGPNVTATSFLRRSYLRVTFLRSPFKVIYIYRYKVIFLRLYFKVLFLRSYLKDNLCCHFRIISLKGHNWVNLQGHFSSTHTFHFYRKKGHVRVPFTMTNTLSSSHKVV